MDDVVKLRANSTWGRLGSGFAVFAVLITSWFAIRAQLGNMLGELTSPADPNGLEIADAAVRLAPGDPLPYILRASAAIDPQRSLQDLEQAVAAAPADYRWRAALARGYEQNDQLDRAEAEFKKAIELAPNYAHPHWNYGNYLLRREETDEAISEFSIAARNHLSYRDQVFSLIWDLFGRDAAPFEQLTGSTRVHVENSPFIGQFEVRAYAAYFLAGKGAGEEALRLWKPLPVAEKEKYSFMLQPMARALFDARQFPAALEFAAARVPDTLAAHSFTNGSFERPLPEAENALFDWKIERIDPKVETGVDSKTASEGARSLKVTFRNYIKPVFANASQTVLVEPSAPYLVQFSAKGEDLRTTSPINVELVNTCENKVIARSANLPVGSTPWTRVDVPFNAGASCPAITVRVFRESCGQACPISGTILLDDFKLVKR